MTAQIVFEVNDKTAEGFASLIKNIEHTDRQADVFAKTSADLAAAVNSLTAQQQQQIAATQQQTIEIQKNRQSFIEWSNSIVEFTGNLRDATEAAVDFAVRKARWAAAKAGVDLTTAALTALAARALKIGGPLLGAKLAIGGVGKAFDATGKKIVAESGPASAAAERMAAKINAGLITVQEITDQTGKSLEELGLKSESNADRIGAAFSELGATAQAHGGRLWDAFMAPIPIVKDAYDATIQHMETRFAEFTRNGIENANALTDALNESMGLNADAIRQQDKFLKKESALKEVREAYRNFETDLQRQIDLRRELGEISEITSRKELDAALLAERKKREELLRTRQWTEENQQHHFTRLRALKEQELAIEKRVQQERVEFTKKSLAEVEEFEQEHQQFLKAQAEIAGEFQKKKLAEVEEYRKSLAAGRQAVQTQAANQNFEIIKNRIARELDAEKQANLDQAKSAEERDRIEIEAAKKRQEYLTRLDKDAIAARSAAEYAAADTRAERAQIAAKTAQELSQAEFNSKLELERRLAEIETQAKQRSLQETKAKFDKETQILRQALEEQKQLREGGPSASALQKAGGSFGRDKVISELIENRLQAGARSGRNGQGRKLTAAEVRRMVIRELRTGQVGQKEIAAAQIDLLQKTAVQGFKTGQFSKVQARAMHEAATELERQTNEVEKNTEDINQIMKFIKDQGQQGKRRQAQRRGTRG